MSELSKVDIYKQIDVLRQSLLDLTMRNQLLNFRPRAMTVEVKDAELAEIYDRLVLKKTTRKLLQFIPRGEADSLDKGEKKDDKFAGKESEFSVDKQDQISDSTVTESTEVSLDDYLDLDSDEESFSEDPNTNIPPETFERSDEKIDEYSSHDFPQTISKEELTGEHSALLWKSPSLDEATLEKNKEIFLSTDLAPAELQRRLFYINQRARSVMEEQGYNILYLAMGLLKWKEENGNDGFREAPLVLIPVELERKRVKGSFKLRWTGEDIITNISLQAKLADDGVEIPDFEMPRTGDGVDEYLNQVKESISDENGWEVIPKVFLGFFSFTKFVMYKDLDPESWPEDLPLEENPLIKTIFDPDEEEELFVGFREEQVDEKLTSENVYHVLDADSSQISVIEDVKNGRDLVVEGPPGTGKSQTIVNLIAELLARGNTVLFVSEKMAALEVVKGRLDSVGLGEFCLELHSKKSNKKNVLEKLESVLRNPKPAELMLEEDLNTIEELKSDLNEYVSLIHSPYGEIKWTPYQFFGVKEKSLQHFEKSQTRMPRFTIQDGENCTLREWQRTLNKFKELEELYKLVKPVAYNPWNLTRPDPILPAEEEEIENLLTDTIGKLNEIEDNAQNLAKISGITIPTTLDEMDHLIAAVEIISSYPSLERDILLNTQWDYDKLQVYNLIKSLEEFQSRAKGLKRFKKGVLEEDLLYLLMNFQEHKPKILKFLSGDFKKAKKTIEKLYLGKAPSDDEIIVQDLEELIKCQKMRHTIRQQDELARSLFGSHWKSEDSDAKNLKNISEWIIKFRKSLEEGHITEKIVIILDSVKQDEVTRISKNLHQNYDQIIQNIENLNNFLHFDPDSVLGTNLKISPIDYLISFISILKNNLSDLQNWSRYSSSRTECMETVGLNLLNLIDKDEIESQDIIPCLEGNFADSMLRSFFLKEPSLSRFVGDVQEKKITEFSELDRKIIKLNRFRIAKKLYENQPSISSTASPRSELGVLKSEFSRKRGHMPIRKLLSICGGIIQNIKPCFMMSPLSIAQYLDPYSVKNLRFDYVIFDEASQVKPEDALGALLRAKSAVIMGDTRQLPPTSFFEILIDVESDDYDLAVLADMESILHLCKRSFPSKMLRWHYRSRHESLIAVSNQEFYDNNLLIYPSPSQDSDELGLKLVHLPDTVYDRGKTATNRGEAKEVIKAVFEHYQKYGDSKSLGVGTFNIRQQQALLEELELQLKLNPRMEKYFNSHLEEYFFIKNLETIQGDERDVIMVSVGYGFDSERRLSHNFGPVNQDGGERRLNVLLTRAREKCVIFSNFRSKDLHLTSSSPFGLRAFKEFLEYAENKTLGKSDLAQDASTAAFEDSVYEFLRDNGYHVHRQVGCAGFRVDLAIEDPDYPGRYQLGITFDGPMYQTSRVARDRDRLRQQVLKGLGWKLLRIWSTDWYRNRSEVQKRLLASIEGLMSEERFHEKIIPPVIEEEPEEELQEETIEFQEETVTDFEDEDNTLEEIPEYKICEDPGVKITGDIHSQPVGDVAHAVMKVVEEEGPIHYDEVVRRVRILWGLSRAGRRVKDVLNEAINLGVLDGQIIQKGNFLYYKDCPIRVRRRTGNPPAKMNIISEEEIAEAVKIVLQLQFATEIDELVREVLKLFGGKVARGPAITRIKGVIKDLMQEKEIEERPDGMIDLVRN